MSENPTSPQTAELSIGALSKATGVPVETLRTWERRYGFPDPRRDESGHRLYPVSTVERIRLTHDALQRGHRPKQTVGLKIEELRAFLADEQPETEGEFALEPGNIAVEQWLYATRDFDGLRLHTLMRTAWMELSPLAFLNDRLQPFLFEVGAAWASGQLSVAQEHFASERVHEFLAEQWRPLADRAEGPNVLCASLPGESHVLGLHMVALVFSLAGLRVVYIGADSPIQDVAASARAQSAVGVAISVSVAADRFASRQDLNLLREQLDDDIELLVGGLGAPRGLGGIHHMDGLDSVAEWALEVAA